jgi:hypothetical protein
VRNRLLVATLLLSACDRHNGSDPSEYTYKITEDGTAQISDVHVYESIENKLLTKTVSYKIVAQGTNAQRFHLLITSITKFVGKKKVSADPSVLLPIVDGSYTYKCSYYYDVKSTIPDDDLADPVCDIRPLGVLVPSAKATKVKARQET